MAEQSKQRNPFDDDAKLEVDPVGAFCDRIDWLRENLLYLSGGTQTVVSGQQKLDSEIGTLSKDVAKQIGELNIAVAKLSERQLWVIGMAAAPCLLVLAVGVLAAWHYFHGAFVVSIASAVVP